MAGEIVHIEFPAEDADRASRFWNGLFGWSFQDSGMPGMDYRMAQTSEQSGAAVFASEDRAGTPTTTSPPTTSTPAPTVRELGGEAEAKSPVPGHGWFAACKDSEGNAFHLWQQDPARRPSVRDRGRRRPRPRAAVRLPRSGRRAGPRPARRGRSGRRSPRRRRRPSRARAPRTSRAARRRARSAPRSARRARRATGSRGVAVTGDVPSGLRLAARLAVGRDEVADVGARIADRAHLPVEHGRDPRSRSRDHDVPEPVVAVDDGERQRLRQRSRASRSPTSTAAGSSRVAFISQSCVNRRTCRSR